MKISVVTLFPDWVESITGYGMPRIASERGVLTVCAVNPRDFAHNKHGRVDDRPFGGGPGMVMQAAPLKAAIDCARQQVGTAKVIAMSPQGARFDQAWAERLSMESSLVLICGRYEGIDERLLEDAVDLELSMGDFVMSGGELAAMSVIDAVCRLLPGVLGDADSAADDSFSKGHLDHPHYSRPEIWAGESVPEVLLSGDHARIARWRLKQSLGKTWIKRPDLLDNVRLDAEQQGLLREFIEEQNTKGSK